MALVPYPPPPLPDPVSAPDQLLPPDVCAALVAVGSALPDLILPPAVSPPSDLPAVPPGPPDLSVPDFPTGFDHIARLLRARVDSAAAPGSPAFNGGLQLLFFASLFGSLSALEDLPDPDSGSPAGLRSASAAALLAVFVRMLPPDCAAACSADVAVLRSASSPPVAPASAPAAVPPAPSPGADAMYVASTASCTELQALEIFRLVRDRVPRLASRPAVAHLLGDERYVPFGGLIKQFCILHWTGSEAAACIDRLRALPVLPPRFDPSVPRPPAGG